MKPLALLILSITACTPDAAPPQDPRCPEGWSFTVNDVGRCAAPDGYTALLYAQFGGSGIYGFGRLTQPCTDPSEGVGCGISMISGMPILLYNKTDIHGTTIDPGAQPVLSTQTSAGGVFKGPIGAASYYVVCQDPITQQVVVTGTTEVKQDTLALYAIDIDHTIQ